MKLECGTTYYKITFADPKLIMPGLQPLVFIGQNIFQNEKEITFYFQDTVSILVFGLIDQAENTNECKIFSFSKDELGTSIVTIEQAVKLVAEAAKKAKALGYPKLQKASGKWA